MAVAAVSGGAAAALWQRFIVEMAIRRKTPPEIVQD